MPDGVAELVAAARVPDNRRLSGAVKAEARFAKTIRDALRDAEPVARRTFADDLAGEVNVDVVLEIDIDDGETEVGDRTDLFDPGKPVHRHLHREGDVLLDLLGSEALGDGEDLYEVRGDVGEGVDRELLVAAEARGGDEHGQGDEEQAAAQREVDDALHVSGCVRR